MGQSWVDLTMIRLKNRNSKIREWEVSEEELLSNHSEIRFNYITNSTTLDGTTRRYQMNKLNWLKFRSLLGEELFGITPIWVNNIGVEAAISISRCYEKCVKNAVSKHQMETEAHRTRRGKGEFTGDNLN